MPIHGFGGKHVSKVEPGIETVQRIMKTHYEYLFVQKSDVNHTFHTYYPPIWPSVVLQHTPTLSLGAIWEGFQQTWKTFILGPGTLRQSVLPYCYTHRHLQLPLFYRYRPFNVLYVHPLMRSKSTPKCQPFFDYRKKKLKFQVLCLRFVESTIKGASSSLLVLSSSLLVPEVVYDLLTASSKW